MKAELSAEIVRDEEMSENDRLVVKKEFWLNGVIASLNYRFKLSDIRSVTIRIVPHGKEGKAKITVNGLVEGLKSKVISEGNGERKWESAISGMMATEDFHKLSGWEPKAK